LLVISTGSYYDARIHEYLKEIIIITGALHKDQCPSLTLSRSFRLRMRNISTQVVEKIETHILYSITFFENCTFYEKMWREKNGRADQATDDKMPYM